MIFSRFKKTPKKENPKPSAEVFPKALTAEGWNRMQQKRRAKGKTVKK